MKIIAVNGSPKADGNTCRVLKTMGEEIIGQGIGFELVHIGQDIGGCTGCAACRKSEGSRCVIDDAAGAIIEKMRGANGIIIGAPTYYGGIAGTMKCFLDRAFFSSFAFFRHKVGAAVTAVRRDGGVDVIHQLNNYFNLSEMIIAPSQYWQAVYCDAGREVQQDEEGFQTIRRNAREMAWLIKALEAGKQSVAELPREPRIATSFVR